MELILIHKCWISIDHLDENSITKIDFLIFLSCYCFFLVETMPNKIYIENRIFLNNMFFGWWFHLARSFCSPDEIGSPKLNIVKNSIENRVFLWSQCSDLFSCLSISTNPRLLHNFTTFQKSLLVDKDGESRSI